MHKFTLIIGYLVLTACGGGGSPAATDSPPPLARPPPTHPGPLTVGDYTVIQLEPMSGFVDAEAHDINDLGQIVGWAFSPDFEPRAVQWTVAADTTVSVQDLGTLPGGTFSRAAGINNVGHVVGVADGASGTQRPIIWTATDGMQDLGVPVGLVGGEAQKINDNGLIVGAVFDSASRFATWTVDQAGTLIDDQDLGDLGGESAIAFGVNIHGNVVGDIFFERGGPGTNQTGFFWSEAGGVVEIGTEEALGINDFDEVVGVLSPEGFGGYVWSAADGLTEIALGITMDVNNSGQVVGRTDTVLQGAFLWENGESTVLPVHENRDFSWAFSINDAGWIVGWSTDPGSNVYANLWIPNQP